MTVLVHSSKCKYSYSRAIYLKPCILEKRLITNEMQCNALDSCYLETRQILILSKFLIQQGHIITIINIFQDNLFVKFFGCKRVHRHTHTVKLFLSLFEVLKDRKTKLNCLHIQFLKCTFCDFIIICFSGL